ncbi:MAG: hypothetical protein ACYCU7_18610 [Acidimicrobiales bacterium]
MTRLSAKSRKALPKGKFALPAGTSKSSKPAFPVEDKAHAEAALRLVGRAVKAGTISPAQAAKVRAKANAELGRSKKKR